MRPRWIQIAFLAMGMLVPMAADAVDLDLKSEVRVRSFYSDNLTDAHDHNGDTCPGEDGTPDQSCDDQESFSDIRFRLRMTATEGVGSGVMEVDLFSEEGRDVATLGGASGTAETGNWRFGTRGLGGGLTTPLVREAFLRLSLPMLIAQGGRQSIHFGHGLVLDDTADAIVAAVPAGPVGISAGAGKLVESDDGAASNADSDLFFTHFSWTPAPGIITALFAAAVQDRGPELVLNTFCSDPSGVPPAFQRCAVSDLGDDSMNLYAAGLTLDVKKERYHVELEMDVLRGKIKTDGATALNPDGDDLDLFGLNGLVRLGGTWLGTEAELMGIYSTGQEPDDFDTININAISPNFVLGNILVNNEMDTDRNGGNIGGLTAVRLGISRAVWNEAEAELSVIWAQMTQRPAPGIDRDLGWEVDLDGSYPIDAHLIWTLGAGYLFTGEAWEGIYGNPEARDDMIKVFSKFLFSY